jgi:hypothetical protein
MANRVEYFRGYLLWGFARRIIGNLLYTASFLTIVFIALYIVVIIAAFGALFIHFFIL